MTKIDWQSQSLELAAEVANLRAQLRMTNEHNHMLMEQCAMVALLRELNRALGELTEVLNRLPPLQAPGRFGVDTVRDGG